MPFNNGDKEDSKRDEDYSFNVYFVIFRNVFWEDLHTIEAVHQNKKLR